MCHMRASACAGRQREGKAGNSTQRSMASMPSRERTCARYRRSRASATLARSTTPLRQGLVGSIALVSLTFAVQMAQ